jgi:hypothetical protein
MTFRKLSPSGPDDDDDEDDDDDDVVVVSETSNIITYRRGWSSGPEDGESPKRRIVIAQ